MTSTSELPPLYVTTDDTTSPPISTNGVTTSSVVVSTTAAELTTAGVDKEDTPNLDLIIGCAVGGAAFLVIIAVVIVIFCRRSKTGTARRMVARLTKRMPNVPRSFRRNTTTETPSAEELQTEDANYVNTPKKGKKSKKNNPVSREVPLPPKTASGGADYVNIRDKDKDRPVPEPGGVPVVPAHDGDIPDYPAPVPQRSTASGSQGIYANVSRSMEQLNQAAEDVPMTSKSLGNLSPLDNAAFVYNEDPDASSLKDLPSYDAPPAPTHSFGAVVAPPSKAHSKGSRYINQKVIEAHDGRTKHRTGHQEEEEEDESVYLPMDRGRQLSK